MTASFAAPIHAAQQPLPMVARSAAHHPDRKLHIGNQAALRRLSATAPGLQARLEIGAVDDPLEREADAVADAVMGMASSTPLHHATPQVSRKCAACEEEEATVQRVASSGPGLAGGDAPDIVQEVISSPGSQLDSGTGRLISERTGYDFSAVRIHTDSRADASARAVAAHAYTVGDNIVFANGQYRPGTDAGRRLIAHELVHVAQQGAAARLAGLGVHPAARPMVARDADDDQIEAIENEKLEIHALLDRCAALDGAQRDRMIGKIGDHAKTTHEERQLACLLAAKFQGTMKRADFYNTYHELLERLQPDQSNAVLDRVGKTIIGKTMYQGTLIDKQSINNVGMKGAPGSSIVVDKRTYVVVDAGVQFKTNDDGGPAKRNNNPGNITVDDNAPLAWSAEIGAYKGRNTDGRFAIFPTYARGRAGAIAWAKKHPSLSLLKYFEQYAPSSEKGNNPGTYADTVAAAVSSATEGTAKRETTIQEIMGFKAKSKDPMEAFVDGQEVAEGYHAATVKLVAKNDPVLPQEVRDFVAEFDKATGDTNAVADKVAAAAAKENSP